MAGSRSDPMLIAIGRQRDGAPEAALFAQYNARLRPPLRLVEIAEPSSTPPADRRRREGATRPEEDDRDLSQNFVTSFLVA